MIKPYGQAKWEAAAFAYNQGALLHQRSPRDGDYLKKFYGDALKEGYSKPTGDPSLPWHIREAREIKWEIEGEISAGSIDDESTAGGSPDWPPNMDLEVDSEPKEDTYNSISIPSASGMPVCNYNIHLY